MCYIKKGPQRIIASLYLTCVPWNGVEPSRPLGHTPLKRARLPIPPPGLFDIELVKIAVFSSKCKERLSIFSPFRTDEQNERKRIYEYLNLYLITNKNHVGYKNLGG